jgi:hypothetical protein
MSTDHTWSARVIVFVADEVLVKQGESLGRQLTERVPELFDGVPTEVKVTSVRQYFLDQLGLDVSVAWDAYDWISLPEQRLCAMTAGAVSTMTSTWSRCGGDLPTTHETYGCI